MAEPRPRFTRLERDERREQILAVAGRLFSERRYADVSTKDIAQQAGIARGLLSYYFGSKHELYLEVVREMLRGATMPLPDAAHLLPTRVVWERSVDGWLDVVESSRQTWLAAVRAGEHGDDPDLRAILDAASEVVVERVIEVLGLDPAAPAVRAVVRCYGGLAQEATREWLERGRLTREQVRELLVQVMPFIAQQLPTVLRGERGATIS